MHYGIKGMRWGVSRSGAKSRVTVDREPSSSDHVKAKQIQKKAIRSMSNEELRTVTTRMQLEKQYKDLKKTNVSSGRKMVSDIIVNTGKQTLTNVASKAMTKTLEKLFTKE